MPHESDTQIGSAVKRAISEFQPWSGLAPPVLSAPYTRSEHLLPAVTAPLRMSPLRPQSPLVLGQLDQQAMREPAGPRAQQTQLSSCRHCETGPVDVLVKATLRGAGIGVVGFRIRERVDVVGLPAAWGVHIKTVVPAAGPGVYAWHHAAVVGPDCAEPRDRVARTVMACVTVCSAILGDPDIGRRRDIRRRCCGCWHNEDQQRSSDDHCRKPLPHTVSPLSLHAT